MRDIVEKLRVYVSDDHDRLCQGREYTCSCGYDDKRDPLMTEAADLITALRAEVDDLGNRLHHVHRLWANNEHALRAKNERLRAALERLSCKCPSNCDWEKHGDICPSWVARAALEGK